MSLEDVGAILANEREKRNLRIEDVASYLKISPRQLRALENGDLDALPHPAYAKGFIRSYANWLGISPEEIQRLTALPKEKPGLVENNEFADNGLSERAKINYRPIIILFLLATICAGGYVAWNKGVFESFIRKDEPSISLEKDIPKADIYLASQDNKKIEENDSPAIQMQKDENREVEKDEVSAITTPASSITQTSGAIQNQTITEPSVIETKKTAVPEQHKLIITALEECWVHSNADKTDTRQFSLRKGDTFALTFTNSLELKLGNAGGVRLRYDGNDLPAPGTSGQVKTLLFPPKEDS